MFAPRFVVTGRNGNVLQKDLYRFVQEDAKAFKGIDLLAGGLPCPPFSIAGKQLGEYDERNLFPITLDLIDLLRPTAIMLENVRGFLGATFEAYRQQLIAQLRAMGYYVTLRLLNASDFGVPQLRPRVLIVAIRQSLAGHFAWPRVHDQPPVTVGEFLFDLMAARCWSGAESWKASARSIAPTIVGGSFKHGGPDLGPTRAKRGWSTLGVDGHGIADEPPPHDFVGMPRLTIPMVSRLQGFPNDWDFVGSKTAAYRQVANAFPPPVARAVATKIRDCLSTQRFVSLAMADV